MTSPAPLITPRAARGLPVGLGGDERLARLVGQGHERAFAALYARYHQQIYRYVRAMVRHESDAQDVLQSAFAKAFVALAEGRRDAPLRPWLYRVAHNEAISTIRRRRPELDLTAAGGLPAPSVDQVAGERARLAMLVADLQALTARQRGALVMRELCGLSHEDIEAALGLDRGGAKQTIFEARRSLAAFSDGRAMSCDEVCRAISDGNGRILIVVLTPATGNHVGRDIPRWDRLMTHRPAARAAFLLQTGRMPYCKPLYHNWLQTTFHTMAEHGQARQHPVLFIVTVRVETVTMALKRPTYTTRFLRRAAGASTRIAPAPTSGSAAGAAPGSASDSGSPARPEVPLSARPLWL